MSYRSMYLARFILRHWLLLGLAISATGCNQLSTGKLTLLFSKAIPDSVWPEGGPEAGGQLLTISGEKLSDTVDVYVGGEVCPLVNVADGSIQCRVPSLSVGWKDVVVSQPGYGTLLSLSKYYAAGALAIGQPDTETNTSDFSNALINPAAIAFYGTSQIYLADSDNHRFVSWSGALTSARAPDHYLMQPDKRNRVDGFYADSASKSYAPHSVNLPWDICVNASNSFVSDRSRNRILIANGTMSTGKATFAYVLGQADLLSTSANRGSTVQANTLSSPHGLWCDGSRLFAADSNNHRVLMWNLPITQNGQSPDLVLGQADLTSGLSNRGTSVAANTLRFPRSVHFDGTNLFIADGGNNRVLVFSTLPTSNGTTADVVLGQTTVSGNGAAVTQGRLNTPYDVHTDATNLYVADSGNNRVMIWNLSTALTTGRNADLVLGQALFTTNSPNSGGVSLSSLRTPVGVASNGTQLFVSDQANHRMLVWNTLPTSNNQSSSFVFGQSANNEANFISGAMGVGKFPWAMGGYAYGDKLFVIDENLRRISMISPLPTVSGGTSSLVIGQASITTTMSDQGTGLFDGGYLTSPTHVFFDSTVADLYVVDQSSHRILVWDGLPAVSGTSASSVLGQTTLTGRTAATTATGLRSPRGVCKAGGTLYVADQGNHRIVGYSGAYPPANGATFTRVLGQATFTVGSANRGGTVAANTLSSPEQLFCDDDHLFVVDSGNHRILMWSPLPTTDGQAADLVLGQPNFISNTAGTTDSLLSSPSSVVFDGTKLFVLDNGNYRLVHWNQLPASNGQAFDGVFGQQDFTSKYWHRGRDLSKRSVNALMWTKHLGLYDSQRLVLGDINHQRLLVIPKP
jgi:hypothetical protein